MFSEAEGENTVIAWVLRFVGFFLMMISIVLFLQPIATAVDIIPFIGDCTQGGLEGCLFPLIAFIIALPISLFVIALSWLAYRPFIAIPICAVSLGFMIWLRLRHKKVTENTPTAASDAIPPPANPGVYGAPAPAPSPPATGQGFAAALDNNNPPASAPSYHAEGDVVYK
jgi:Transmembrane protein 43